MINKEDKEKIEAATLRRLVAHLQKDTNLQNIDLMILANFCRNCISKWYSEEAKKIGEDIDYDAAREFVYGMPYDKYKKKHQKPATEEQMRIFNERNNKEK